MVTGDGEHMEDKRMGLLNSASGGSMMGAITSGAWIGGSGVNDVR